MPDLAPPRSAPPAGDMRRLTTAATRGALVVAAAAILGCLYAMLGRLGYRCELEWMTGSVYDSIERIREGKPLYTAPSLDWTPFMYPPLYFELVAKLPGKLPLNLVGRGISIVCTLVMGATVWRLSRRLGASKTWAFLGVGAFAGAFADTSFWYDLERVDSLFMALVALAVLLLVERAGLVATALAGAILGLAFFAKQPAAAFVAGITGGLLVARSFRRAAALAVPAVIVIAAGVGHLQHTTDDWFGYYVLKMPGAHGVVPSLFKVLFFEDVPRAFVLFAAAVFVWTGWARRVLRRSVQASEPETIFASALAAGAIAAGSSRVHLGGWDNVLMFFTTFAAIALAVAGDALTRRLDGGRAAFLLPTFAAFQVVIWAYDPAHAIPPRSTVASARAFEAKVKELEREGEVLVTGRGNVTTPRHAHHAAFVDVFRTEKRVTEAFKTPFRDRRFAAVVIDNFNDIWLDFLPELKGELFPPVFANYYVAERLPVDMPDAHVGFRTHPRFVLRRRQRPIPEAALETVRCRARVERTLAESLERAGRGGATSTGPVDIESIAERACDAGLDGLAFPPGYSLGEELFVP